VIFTRPNLNYFYVILLLVSPFLIRYQLIQVRQGLAIGIFSLAYYSNRAFYKYLFYIITPFVHSVFFLVYPVLVLHTLLKRYKFSFNQRYIIIITTTFGLYLIALYVADILGHRAYSRLIEDQINVSGYNFIYYLIYFFYFIFSGRSVKDNFDIPIYFISLYLLSYFIFPFAGRVFGAISLIILISLFELKLSPKNKIVLVCFYLFNLILDWYFRFSKDGFGFLEIIY